MLMPTPSPAKLRCPKDATLMEKLRIGRLEVDHCARCGSMWFDAYEMEAALREKNAVGEIDYGTAKHEYKDTMHRASPLVCPRDGTDLTAISHPNQPHVIIDVCTQCKGVLLDAGELKDLSEFTLAERVKAFFKR